MTQKKLLRRSIVVFILLLIAFLINKNLYRLYFNPETAAKNFLKQESGIKEFLSSKSVRTGDDAVYLFHTEQGLYECTVIKTGIIFWHTQSSNNLTLPYQDSPVQYGYLGLSNNEKSMVYGIVRNDDIVKIQITLKNQEKYEFILDNSRLFLIVFPRFIGDFIKIEGFDALGNVMWYDPIVDKSFSCN